ncbi:unnamed protein product [Mucor hiemalis]
MMLFLLILYYDFAKKKMHILFQPTRSNSMSISNLLDSESDSSMLPPHILPYHSLSSESKPLFQHNEARRNSVKKGFQICITPRRSSTTRIDHINKSPLKSFRPANSVRIPINGKSKSHLKYKRNTIHIHISYRIHAHRASLTTRPIVSEYMYIFKVNYSSVLTPLSSTNDTKRVHTQVHSVLLRHLLNNNLHTIIKKISCNIYIVYS